MSFEYTIALLEAANLSIKRLLNDNECATLLTPEDKRFDPEMGLLTDSEKKLYEERSIELENSIRLFQGDNKIIQQFFKNLR